MTDFVRVLLVDDDPDEYILTKAYFDQFTSRQYQLEWTHSFSVGLDAAVSGQYDVYLIDYRLGDQDGLTLMRQAVSLGCRAPMILLTGQGGFEIDMQAMEAGASDYLNKSLLNPVLLERSIRYSLEHFQAEERARRQTARANALVRAAARLNEKLSLRAVIASVCEESAVALGLQAASLSLFDTTQARHMHAGQSGLPAGFDGTALVADRLPEELNQPKGFTVTDLSQVEDDTHRSFYQMYGIQSLACLPLPHNGTPLGLLYIYSLSHHRQFDDDDLALLRGLASQAALAISNARLYEQEQARSSELSAIANISALLRQAHSSVDILNLALRESNKMLRTQAGAIILYNDQNKKFSFALADGLLASNTGHVFDSSLGISSQVLQNDCAFVTPDYSRDPHYLSDLKNAEAIGPAVLVPLRSEVETLGVLMLARPRRQVGKPFLQDEVRLLAAIGEMVGNSLRRIRLFEEAQRRVCYTQALNDIGRAIASTLDLGNTLEIALSQGTSLLQIDAAAVLRLDPAEQTLRFAAGYGFNTSAIRRTCIDIHEGYAGAAIHDRRLVSIPCLDNARAFSRMGMAAAEGFVSYYIIPLVTKDEVKGVLEVYQRSYLQPDSEWLQFLETLAGQIAVAVDNAIMFEDLQRTNNSLADAYDTTLEGWSRALDLRDKDTEGHTQRVTELTMRLAHELGFEGDELVHVRRGALLHDIGKMAIPDHILHKPGPLTDEEWQVMRQHTAYAYELLSPIEYLRPSLDIPYCHHERWDGHGYPRQLQGEEIPMSARLFAIIDVWDALLSDRPYRPAWDVEKAVEYIREQAGKHFDPSVSEIFLRMVETQSI